MLEGLRAGAVTAAQVTTVIGEVVQELLKALKTEKSADVACDFAEATMRTIKACFESGGEMANGVQPQPLFLFPARMVNFTLQELINAVKRSVHRRTAALATAVRRCKLVYPHNLLGVRVALALPLIFIAWAFYF